MIVEKYKTTNPLDYSDRIYMVYVYRFLHLGWYDGRGIEGNRNAIVLGHAVTSSIFASITRKLSNLELDQTREVVG